MGINKIQDKLRSEFTGNERKIIFWYDENKKFEEEISNFSFDNAKIIVLDGFNYFKTKYTIESLDKESNFLIYAPFAKPDDIENPLLDTYLYSKPFYADYYSLLAEELNVPVDNRSRLEMYSSFFTNKARTKAFKEINADFEDVNNIDLAILAALCKVKVIDFNEIFKAVVNQGIIDNSYLANIEKYGSIEKFWDMCRKYFGYSDAEPTLEKMFVGIFISNIYNVTLTDLPDNLNQYILPRVSEASVFLTNYKNNSLTSDSFEKMSSHLGKLLQISSSIKKMSFDEIKNNDVFVEFDYAYIKYLVNYAEEQINLENINSYLNSRLNTHFYSKFEHTYETIRYAFYLLKEINIFDNSFHDVTVADYANKYAVIDKYYDLYVYHFDKREIENGFDNLNTLIENKYNNTYLSKLNEYWDSKLLEYGSYQNIPGLKQKDFYSQVVSHMARSGRSRNESLKVCVIISDAFRYECGMQLNDYFEFNEKYETRIYPMISTIPSYTQLGMATLLPNRSIHIGNDYSVNVNGRNSQGISNRNQILQAYDSSFRAVSFEEIKNKTKEELRNEFNDYKLIYVYHNQVDARGDHALSENEVFDAVHESFKEIDLIIRKMRGNLNFNNFIITADHGFIYRRKKLVESDKIDLNDKTNIYLNKRFIYSKNKVNQQGIIEFNTDYLDSGNSMITYVPKGGNIFKVQGAGQNYVHGGASLQEMVVPVIELKTTMSKVETKSVNIDIIASNMKVTSLLAQFNFIQVEQVSDLVKERKFIVYFADDNGNAISNEVIINANITSDDMNQRTFTCRFNLINKQYDSRRKYYMIIKAENGLEYKRYEFVMDIAFANDFDF